MNIKTAQRLYELRKKHGYSQEELADKLGVSRQAVSKWERSESSPDTDNLIELAKLYGVTLDELLNGDEAYQAINEDKQESTSSEKESKKNNKGFVFEDDDDRVVINGDGIFVSSGKDKIHLSGASIRVNDNDDDEVTEKDHEVAFKMGKLAVTHKNMREIIASIWSLCILTAYIVLGFTLDNGWSHYWFLFLLVPVLPSLVKCIYTKRASHFAYPFVVASVYCALGMFLHLWHPLWVVFLSIPVYYIITVAVENALGKCCKHHINISVNDKDED